MGQEVMLMYSRSVILLSLALAAPALASAGCGGSVAASPAAVSGTRAPVAQSAHGQVKLLGEALGDVPLSDAQRGQIEKLASDADARHEQGRGARHDLLLAIAAQVEAGTIDRAALQPKIDALVAAIQSAQPADRAAFEQLHGILAPDQRLAFVDAVEARFAEHAGRARERLGMREWAEALKLTDAQRDQIRTTLRQSFAEHMHHGEHDGEQHHGPWEGGRRGAKVLEAFKQDRFVFDQVVPPRDVGKGAAMMTDRFVTIAGQVLPILTPEQRTIAAARLRERASAVEIDQIP
jgi:Spy/CpxP family protein refolding chaperone